MGYLLSFWVTSPSWDSDLSHKKLCEEKLQLKTMVFRSWAHTYLSFLVPKRSSCILISNLCTCTVSFYLLKDCIPPTPSLLNKEMHIVPVPVSDSAMWVRAYRPKQKLNGPFSRQQFHVLNCLHTKTQSGLADTSYDGFLQAWGVCHILFQNSYCITLGHIAAFRKLPVRGKKTPHHLEAIYINIFKIHL